MTKSEILTDPENLEWTEEMFERAKREERTLPSVVQAMIGPRKAGRPKTPDAKQAVTLRLKPDLLRAYQAEGVDWRGRMSEVLAGTAPAPKRAG